MTTHYSLNTLPRFRRSVVTIGSFDGVHRGHQQLLARIVKLAKSRGGESIVITFDPHPRQVLQPDDHSLRLLSTTEEKARYCEASGIDHLIVVPFTREFANQAPSDYIDNFLVKYCQPERIVIGYDHRFGKNREGNIEYLSRLGKTRGYEVIEIDAQDVANITVSSTKVRQALTEGKVEQAAVLLGRPYELTGTVVRGQQIGRTIGYPTANLRINHPRKLIPENGIYAVTIQRGAELLEGMLYIGDRPSLNDGRGITVEVNIFDFDQEVYDEELTVLFHQHLRGDMDLPDLEALRQQLALDETTARQALQDRFKAKIIPADTNLQLDTAVVILNYNGRDYLEKYLPTALQHCPDYARVVVADNASTDDSVAFLRQSFPEVKLVVLPENYGFANGYNMALQQVEADIYVLLNSDVRVTPRWIESIIPDFEDPSVGAVQPKVLAEMAPERFEYAGAAGGYIDYLGYPFCRGRIFHETERDEGQYDGKKEVFWATGAAFFCRASLFHALGGFEPEYFAHAEEIDLCWRMKRAGYRVMANPASVIYHVGGGTLAYDTPRKTYLNFRNTLTTSFKNEPVSRLIWWLPVRLILDGVAGGLFFSQRKYPHIKSILQAHYHFYRHIPLWLKRRELRTQQINAASIGKDRTEYGRVADSVIVHYYLLGHQRFSDIYRKQIMVEELA